MIDDSALLHAEPRYDAQRAHEYYLRNRHLKGRQRRAQQQSSQRTASARNNPAPRHAQVRRPTVSAKQRRAEAQARVAQLEQRLDHLKDVLQALVDKAKARSGIEPKKKETAKQRADRNARAKGKSPKSTLKERREARKR